MAEKSSSQELEAFFAAMPDMMPLYELVAAEITKLGPSTIKVQKSQISFSNKHGFAFVWLPINRKIKGRPDRYIVVTFGLNRQEKDPRIAESVEPYPDRWTHHVIVDKPSDIDDQLVGWLAEAYDFAASK